MKAVYINLDPYLAAFAAWLKGGKTGPAPTFNPLPVAVTIPLGESAAIFYQTSGTSEQTQEYDSVSVDGQTILVGMDSGSGFGPNAIAWEQVPGLSTIAPSAKYAVAPATGDTVVEVTFADEDAETLVFFSIPVLVRRETASGPVDLVDFAPPASAIAAGTDLKGATFDGNKIVAAAGTGALSAPAGA